MELEKIKVLLRDLALSHGMTDADLNQFNESTNDNEWHIDWKQDMTRRFLHRMERLEAAIELYETAMLKGDRLTAKAGLMDAKIRLQSLSSLFDDMRHDVEKAYLEPRFDWPAFPDDWKIPPEYGYKE